MRFFRGRPIDLMTPGKRYRRSRGRQESAVSHRPTVFSIASEIMHEIEIALLRSRYGGKAQTARGIGSNRRAATGPAGAGRG
jgi:hypothetical protein